MGLNCWWSAAVLHLTTNQPQIYPKSAALFWKIWHHFTCESYIAWRVAHMHTFSLHFAHATLTNHFWQRAATCDQPSPHSDIVISLWQWLLSFFSLHGLETSFGPGMGPGNTFFCPIEWDTCWCVPFFLLWYGCSGSLACCALHGLLVCCVRFWKACPGTDCYLQV